MILSSISVETWLIVTAASELTKYMIALLYLFYLQEMILKILLL